MRLAILSLVAAAGCHCSSTPPPESPPAQAPAPESAPGPGASGELAALCRDLSSSNVDVRVRATSELLRLERLAVTGGTEQQMEAAADLCQQRTGDRPDWSGADEASGRPEGCLEQCENRRIADGESAEDAQSQCMQDCIPGE